MVTQSVTGLRSHAERGNDHWVGFDLRDRSHALRGNAAMDALRPALEGVTQSVTGCIPTRSVGTINGWVSGIWSWFLKGQQGASL